MTRERMPVDLGFRRWAPTYEHENPLTELDRLVTDNLAPPPPGGALLATGCGTGRRLPQPDSVGGPRLVVGLDLVPAMLFQGRHRLTASRHLVAAGLEAVPLRPGLFDIVWCRLTIGFVPEVSPAFASLAHQLGPTGRLLVTDLHPDLVAEGAERGFRADDGSWKVIEARAHSIDRLIEAASGAGLEIDGRLELPAGPELEEKYRTAGREDLYRKHSQRPIVFGLSFRRV